MRRTSSPSWAKSEDRIEGAMRTRCFMGRSLYQLRLGAARLRLQAKRLNPAAKTRLRPPRSVQWLGRGLDGRLRHLWGAAVGAGAPNFTVTGTTDDVDSRIFRQIGRAHV